MSEQLKVVIILKEGKASVGIQSPDCDPVLTVMQGSLEEVLPQVPGLVASAREKWREKPKYPKTTRIPPPAPASARPAATAARAPAAPAKPKEGQTAKLF